MMSVKSALVVGLVAAAFAGCATGTGSMAVDPTGSVEGQASPPTWNDNVDRCEGGTYNRAAGLCVSEGV
jgi:hypothetical protein